MNWLQCSYDLLLNADSQTESPSISLRKNLLIKVPNYELSIEPHVIITQSENFDFSDFGWCWNPKNKLPDFAVRTDFADPFTDESFEVQGLTAQIYLVRCGWESNAPVLKKLALEGNTCSEFKKDTAVLNNLKLGDKFEGPSFQANLIICIEMKFIENGAIKTGIIGSFMSNPIWMVTTPLRNERLKIKAFESSLAERELLRVPAEPKKQRGFSLNLNAARPDKMASQKSTIQKVTSPKRITTLISPKRTKTLTPMHTKSHWNLGSPKKC